MGQWAWSVQVVGTSGILFMTLSARSVFSLSVRRSTFSTTVCRRGWGGGGCGWGGDKRGWGGGKRGWRGWNRHNILQSGQAILNDIGKRCIPTKGNAEMLEEIQQWKH